MKIDRIESREQQILAKLRARPRLEGQHVSGNCPTCLSGTQIVGRFCRECGTQLVRYACPNCGNSHLALSQHFCHECGADLR